MVDTDRAVTPFRILVMCTANVCRSPMAEALLRLAMEDAGIAAHLSSAGFLTQDEEATPVVVEIMGERGIDISDHRSRMVTAAMVEEADLVVAMERRHVRDLALLTDGAVGRIDTLGGLVDRLRSATGDSPRERVASATAPREAGDMLGNGPDEVDDPFGKSKKVNREAADRLTDLCNELILLLFPGGGDGD